MAVTPVYSSAVGVEDGTVQIWTWTLTTANPIGLAVQVPEWNIHTWSAVVAGTTTGSATLALEGSNTDTTADFGALSAVAAGTAYTATAVPFCKTTLEKPRYVRPNLTSVGSGATWVVTLCATRLSVRP